MNSKLTFIFILLLICGSLYAQQPVADTSLERINKDLPHKFKALKTGATIEAVRDHGVVKLYMLIDDIEQYLEVQIERSNEMMQNFSQCKSVTIQKGKYKNNYIELIDQYPLAYKMSNRYRIRTISIDGVTRIYPPVPIIVPEGVAGK